MTGRPVFHLSVPVRDLAEAVEFYTARLGARIGRHTDSFVDALVFGAQVTLQNDPAAVDTPMPRTRHFGATLPWDEWESVVARLPAPCPTSRYPPSRSRGSGPSRRS